MRGVPTSVMGYRYVNRSDIRKIHYWDINNLYETGLCQYLPTGNFVEIEVTERIEEYLLSQF